MPSVTCGSAGAPAAPPPGGGGRACVALRWRRRGWCRDGSSRVRRGFRGCARIGLRRPLLLRYVVVIIRELLDETTAIRDLVIERVVRFFEIRDLRVEPFSFVEELMK